MDEKMSVDTVTERQLRRAWLVFLERGNSFSVFRKENKRLGPVRKIPLEILESMMWGDKVCQFYKMSGMQWPVWFATWPITKLLGLTEYAIMHILSDSEFSACDVGGAIIIRASSRYISGVTYRVNNSLKRIASLLRDFQETGGEVGDPMIGCGAGVLKYLGTPFPGFPNIIVDPDIIRPFNYLQARADLKKPASNTQRGIGKAFYFLPAMEDPEREWPENTLANFPVRNYREDMEGGVGGGLVETALNLVPAGASSEHIAF